MSQETELIIEQLREAQAIEQASLSLLAGHLRSAPPGAYRTAARRHLDETRRHAHQVGERLTDLGATRSPLGLALTLGEALLGRVTGVALAPLGLLAGPSTPDALLRHVQDEIASEAREGATYEALERLAAAAGDQTTASLARAIRADEERHLDTLRDLLETLADRVARVRLGARPQPERPAPAPGSRTPTNGGPVTGGESRTPYADRAERLRAARRAAPRTPDGPTRAEAAAVREAEREAETPVETEGAADPGAEVHVDAPWEGYDEMKATDVVARVRTADAATRAMVRLYEAGNKARKSVLDATG
jgi:ferritin-like metal-binding protein YciE